MKVPAQKFFAIVFLTLILFSSAQTTFAQSARPGWGFGDENNIHVGPPGQSVFPDIKEHQREIIQTVFDNLLANSSSLTRPYIQQLFQYFNQIFS
jgi:hypothetical protein